MKDEISARNKAKREQMLMNLRKAKLAPKGQHCPVKECDGRLTSHVTSTNSRYRSGHGGFVYLPGECRIRRNTCKVCGHTFRTVEIPIERFEKDLNLIRKLKLALKEYIA